jgi:acetoacetyl-CoA synthetase
MCQAQPSFNAMVALLLPIWQRVLHQPNVQPDDNFFNLGGTPALAETLFSEVREATGREFPAVCIYPMNSPVAMASVLLEDPGQQRFAPTVLMRAGEEGPPVFLAHGIGSNLLECCAVVQHLKTRRPIYGLQSRGIYGTEEPHDRVEDMACYNLEAIHMIQAEGPYRLVGYSLGGLVMLEIARMLVAKGQRVDLLVLVDSYPYRTHLRPAQRVILYSRLAFRHMEKRLWRRPEAAADGREVPPEGTPAAASRRNLRLSFQRERESAYNALKSYCPGFYSGVIKFIRAEIPTRFPSNARAVWAPLAKRVDVETLPGDHLALLSTHYKLLAATLSSYLADLP